MYWNYFLSLEDDLMEISRFIDFDERNFGAFSTVNTKFILAACSEIDVWLKELCFILDGKKPSNINGCREIIQGEYEGFSGEAVHMPSYGFSFTPWVDWSSNNNPKWWHDYNNLKHHRLQNYDKASLGNVIQSMCALFAVLIYFHERHTSNPPFSPKAVSPASRLFRLDSSSPKSFPYVLDKQWQ